MHWIALQPLPEPSLPEPSLPEGDPGQAMPKTQATSASSRAPALVEALADDLTALGWWALQFTPKVARVEDVLVLEVLASERLFGGRKQLLHQIYQSNKPVALVKYARAATSLIAIARLQISPSSSRDVDGLPLTTLFAARAHLPTLARIGCTHWGQLRALPRGGVVRRFGAPLLDALDRAYGKKPELYPWLVLPEVFEATLELQAQVETAPALMFGARRLLGSLQVWLQMRQCGVLACELGWSMDARRNTATQGQLVVRTAQPTRDMAHLQRLLAEHLARLTLPAPVLYLHLRTLHTEKLDSANASASASLLLDDLRPGDSLHQMLERLSARLGSHQVLQLQARTDHRPECMQTWQPVSNYSKLIANYVDKTRARGEKHSQNQKKSRAQAQPQAQPQSPSQAQSQVKPKNHTQDHVQNHLQAHIQQDLGADALYPTWLLAQPLKLAMGNNAPLYQGVLTLLAGPQRLEAGWWDIEPCDREGDTSSDASSDASCDASGVAKCALRDYFLARSEQAGLVWIYRERLAGQGGAGQSAQGKVDADAGWYLHGLFA